MLQKTNWINIMWSTQSNLPTPCSQRRWSEPESWPSGQLPQEGEDVTVSSRWRMLLDVTPPTLGNLYIFGELIFEDERDYNLTANLVSIHTHLLSVVVCSKFSTDGNIQIIFSWKKSYLPLLIRYRMWMSVYSNTYVRCSWNIHAISAHIQQNIPW